MTPSSSPPRRSRSRSPARSLPSPSPSPPMVSCPVVSHDTPYQRPSQGSVFVSNQPVEVIHPGISRTTSALLLLLLRLNVGVVLLLVISISVLFGFGEGGGSSITTTTTTSKTPLLIMYSLGCALV